MTIFSLDHLHLICEDLEGMIRFWTDGLGASFKEYKIFGGAQGAVLRLDNLQVNLRVPKESEQGGFTTKRSLGYDHLGLRVADLTGACSHLEKFGCRITSGPTELSDRKIVFLSGPEELTLELMHLF